MQASYRWRRNTQHGPAALAVVLAIGVLLTLAVGLCFVILFGSQFRRAFSPAGTHQLVQVSGAPLAKSAGIAPVLRRSLS